MWTQVLSLAGTFLAVSTPDQLLSAPQSKTCLPDSFQFSRLPLAKTVFVHRYDHSSAKSTCSGFSLFYLEMPSLQPRSLGPWPATHLGVIRILYPYRCARLLTADSQNVLQFGPAIATSFGDRSNGGLFLSLCPVEVETRGMLVFIQILPAFLTTRFQFLIPLINLESLAAFFLLSSSYSPSLLDIRYTKSPSFIATLISLTFTHRDWPP